MMKQNWRYVCARQTMAPCISDKQLFFEGGAEMPNLYDQQTNNPLKPFRKALNALMILASTPTPKFKLRVTKVS